MRPATRSEIATAVEKILREEGAMGDDALLERLQTAGLELGIRPAITLDEVLHDDGVPWVACLADGRHGHLPSLLAGCIFTHRLTSVEVAHDLVFVDPDLAALSMLADDETQELRMAGGGLIEEVLAGFDADDELLAARGIPADAITDSLMWLLPTGSLAGLAVGSLVGFRWDGSVIGFEAGVTEAETPALLGTRLVESVGDASDGSDEAVAPVPFGEVITTLAADDPTLFAEPRAPLGELAESFGLVREGELVGPPGFDFGRWRDERRLAEIVRLHRLDDHEALSVLALLGVHHHLAASMEALEQGDVDDEEPDDPVETGATSAPDDEPHRTSVPDDDVAAPGDTEAVEPDGFSASWAKVEAVLLEVLAEARVAEAFFQEAVGIGTQGAAALGALAESMAERAPAASQAALAWLQAAALERLGDVDGAEAGLEQALSLDPGFAPAACDLARFASDRGDLERALSLLRRSGAEPDDPLFELLQGLRHTAPSGLGRNDRCWCGSGRKYKQCHQGREAPPLEERGGWLIRKAAMATDGGPWRYLLLEVAQARARWEESGMALLGALEDPLVMDVVLFEGGAFEDFLARRGHLLPDDERTMADQWLLVDRSLYDVEATDPGVSISVRDVRTGDHHLVRERTASRSLRPGELICVRIVPVGDTMQLMGGVEPVAVHQRDELLALLDDAPDPIELVDLLSRRLAPPVLHNTEGHDLVMCEVEMSIGPAAAEMLTGRLGPPEGDPPTWYQRVTTDGMERLRASYVLDGGDHLRIETNSIERADEAIALVRGLDPDAIVVADHRTPMTDLTEAMSRSADDGRAPAGNLLDDPPPELRAQLQEMVRTWEDQWLDEPIPALGGVTPRQAAADPTRRGDLDRLLSGFPRSDELAMDPERIRGLLGLDA